MSELATVPVTALKGVGAALAEKLARVGLETLQDVKKRIQELNVKLSEKVRKEKISDTNSQVWAHVRQTLVENLSISNPRFQTDS